MPVQDGELPVLPLSIPGAVAMSRAPDAGDNGSGFVSGDQFFIYNFDRQLMAGLAGLSFDEGQFGVFAYVTRGADLLGKLQQGDVIERASLASGEERLVVPSS